MMNARATLCLCLCLCLRLALTLPEPRRDRNWQLDPANYACNDVLVCDVAVIGGGASGTYGAIKLKDMGRSVVVVEKQPQFGGHVETYTDPATGTAIEYGVQAYINETTTTDFFDRFDVPLFPSGFPPGQRIFADFKTGQVLRNFSLNFALSSYAAQLNKYPDPSLGWNLPHPVPQDLLLPFRDFVEKYSLQDVAYTIASLSNGMGDISDKLTVYVFSSFNNVVLNNIATSSGVTTRNNSELYAKARAELGSSALVDSTVVAGLRPTKDAGVRLAVQTPTGLKLVMASQVLISIPLGLDNMSPFGLDSREHGVFEQFYATAYYSCVVTNTGLIAGATYSNAGANTTYHIPTVPGAYRVSASKVDDIFYVWYGAETPLSENAIKADITATIRRLSQSDASPQFLAFTSHTPYKQQVSASAIANGFYDELNSLQGYRNTWYTGNAFDGSGSSSLWDFTARLLPDIDSAVKKQRHAGQSSHHRC